MSGQTTAEISALLVKLATGDASARQELLARSQERLRRLASKMLHGGFARLNGFVQTDDVLANVHLRLLKRWDRETVDKDGTPLKEASAFLDRVSRLMREVLLDLVRKYKGRDWERPKFLSLDGVDSSEEQCGHDPGTVTDNPEEVARHTEFHEAIQALPGKLRQVVDLHGYLGLPHKEVGRLLGISESTSRTRWVEARLQLSKKFGVGSIDHFNC